MFLHHNGKDYPFEYNNLHHHQGKDGVCVRVTLDDNNSIANIMKIRSFAQKIIEGEFYHVDPIITVDMDEIISKYGIDFPHRIISASKPIKYVKIIGGWDDQVLNVLQKKETKIGWFLFPTIYDESISEHTIRESIKQMLVKIDELSVKLQKMNM